MRTIFKYPIAITDEQIITVLGDSKLLSVGLDPNDNPAIWVEGDRDADTVDFCLLIIPTGAPIPEYPVVYLGSFVQDAFVWHAYAIGVRI